MAKIPHVKLLIESSRGYGRGLLRGITRYARLHGPWSFIYESPFYQRSRRRCSQNAKPPIDGIIAHLANQKDIKKTIKNGVPAVVQGIEEICDDLPTIIGNDVLVGRMGAAHFIERGFSNLAFFGEENMYWSRIRGQSFCSYAARAGKKIFVFTPHKKNKQLLNWLNDLPKPVGIMACNDDYAKELIEASVIGKFQVPEQVAILGVDNDELICELSDFPLSSIAYNSDKAGYEAAELLDRMMKAKKVINFKITVEPLYVVTRRSTDTIAIEDKAVSSGIHYIRNHIRENFSVEDVSSAMMLSRRMAELRFKKILGRTIFEEIRNCRIQLVCRLLIDSDFTISEIASKTGFTTTTYMAATFRKQTKMTPLAYRRKHRS